MNIPLSSSVVGRALYAASVALLVGCAEPPADVATGDAAVGDTAVVADVVTADVVTADVVTADITTTDVVTTDDRPPSPPADVVAEASVDAGRCGPDNPCPVGTQCYSTGCLPATPLGGRCEPRDIYHPCVFGADCAPDAAGVYSCVPSGSEGSYCNRSTVWPVYNECNAGLACVLEVSGVSGYYRCRPGLRPDDFCGDSYERCPVQGNCCGRGSTCQSVGGTLRCVVTPAAGTAGGTCLVAPPTPDGGVTTCPIGLTCTSSFFTEPQSAFCVRTVALGAECGVPGVGCPAGAECVESGGALRCVPTGSIGARCRDTSPACDEGLECNFPSGSGVCRRRVARGGACDATLRTTACAVEDGCTSADFTEPGQCAAPGTVAGADCRGTEPRCDGALECSNFSRYRSTCRVVASVGSACDLGGIRTLCPDATRCVPTTASSTPTCMSAVAEVEPNDAPAAPMAAVARSTLYAGAVSTSDPQDCYAVTVRAGESLYLETVARGLRLSLHGPSGTELGRWVVSGEGGAGPLAGSARLRPETVSVLRELGAGTYAVCMGSRGGAAMSYQLAIGVIPPSP